MQMRYEDRRMLSTQLTFIFMKTTFFTVRFDLKQFWLKTGVHCKFKMKWLDETFTSIFSDLKKMLQILETKTIEMKYH